VVRELTAADTADACALLRARPVHNVFLDYVVSSGLLGKVPGFWGYAPSGRIEGLLMIGPLGGTALEVRNPKAHEPLALAASQAHTRPRHIVGDEAVTAPFFAAYSCYGPRVIWERREPYYLVSRAERPRPAAEPLTVERAIDRDLEETLANSALQHREDLGDDRCGADPEGFRRRHTKDLRDGRWWVARDAGRVVFQVHVGAENAHVVQLGGVMVPAEARNQGWATRGMAAIVDRLLEWRPAVGLFCYEHNLAARRVYERVGFRALFHYRSWLLDERLER
jgi:uncharacterized protein